MIGTTEIIIILLIVLILFGGKKIPELMRGLGKGVKSFKDGVNGVEEEKKAESGEEKPTPDPSLKGGERKVESGE